MSNTNTQVEKLKVGDAVPHFSLPNEKGEIVSRESLLGKKYILFFYPKDDSPGCTKEACSLRDNFKIFKKHGYEIYGVSPDKEKKHQKFIDKYEFQFSLLADTEKEMINTFGYWGPKKFMGREIVGVYRTTTVIDEKGEIIAIIDKVKTKEHAQQLIDALGL
ncbi:MAG: thioredoxin-dependent thiol peroxidase [Saprospiraceae bacterium]|nr:thioredoxin-dependent thiol peroxidase [Saprospiraceae bacterium]